MRFTCSVACVSCASCARHMSSQNVGDDSSSSQSSSARGRGRERGVFPGRDRAIDRRRRGLSLAEPRVIDRRRRRQRARRRRGRLEGRREGDGAVAGERRRRRVRVRGGRGLLVRVRRVARGARRRLLLRAGARVLPPELTRPVQVHREQAHVRRVRELAQELVQLLLVRELHVLDGASRVPDRVRGRRPRRRRRGRREGEEEREEDAEEERRARDATTHLVRPRASPPARVRLDGLLTVVVKIGVPNFLRASPSVLREYGVSNCLPV